MELAFIITGSLGLFILGILVLLDFKHMVLPNVFVGLFAITGIAHHILQHWQFISPLSSFLGFLVGGGFLLLIRAFANWRYKKNTLGMGDVKLMMAGGIWLGFPHILIALSIGAFASVIIGILYIMYQNIIKHKGLSLKGTKLPAGPGFIVGIVATFVWFHQIFLQNLLL